MSLASRESGQEHHGGSIQDQRRRGADRCCSARARDHDTAVLRRRCRPPTGEGAGHRPAHVRNALASHTGGETQDEARAALHGVRIPQARRVRCASRGAVHIARLTPGRSPATLAVIRSEAELRSLEAAPFNPRMLRRIATGARTTLLTATDFTIADGLFGRLETPLLRRTPRKIDQPISIVFETEQIADRRNSPLNSRARISDGSGIRFFVVSGKIFLDGSTRYHASEPSSGSERWQKPRRSAVIFGPVFVLIRSITKVATGGPNGCAGAVIAPLNRSTTPPDVALLLEFGPRLSWQRA